MKVKLIHSIAGLTLALGLGVASAGPAPTVQGSADSAVSAEPFSAVLGSADYLPMSDQDLSSVTGKQLGSLLWPVISLVTGLPVAGPIVGQVVSALPTLPELPVLPTLPTLPGLPTLPTLP